jgi:hypothetical protein
MECSQLLAEGPGLDGKSESTVLHSPEAWKIDETRTRCQRCLNCNKKTRHLGNLDILLLLLDPSASRYWYFLPKLVIGGCGIAFQGLLMKALVSWVEIVDPSP